MPKPESLSWVEAASIPENFLTGTQKRDSISPILGDYAPFFDTCAVWMLIRLTFHSLPGPYSRRAVQEGRGRSHPCRRIWRGAGSYPARSSVWRVRHSAQR